MSAARPFFTPQGQPLPRAELVRAIRERTDTVILSFSRGKDALAAWLELKDHFKVVPVYLYSIPGLLSFERTSLAYYEQTFGTRIIRLPHPSLPRMLCNYVDQSPERIEFLQGLMREGKLFPYDYDLLFEAVRQDWGLPKDAFVATGVRAVDSPNRWSAIHKFGPVTLKRKPPVFYPVWDMRKAELIALLRKSGVRLPYDYRLFGRSFDGIDYRFLKPIHDHLPEDYARILEWFPLAGAVLRRDEYARKAA